MKKLYRCSVTVELFVLANGETEAETVASESYKEECDSYADITAIELKSPQDLPKEWRQSLPYGSEKDPDYSEWTCFDIAEDLEKRKREEELSGRQEEFKF